MRYRIFKRRFWQPDRNAPAGRSPYPGRKITLGFVNSQEEARQFCTRWNENRTASHVRWGTKAEFEGV